MVDETNNVFPEDEKYVNIKEFYEVKYWTMKFNCSKEELEKAVKTVGVSADKVGDFLKKMQTTS